jgi:hypothetical protein
MRDTTPEAAKVQTEILRGLTGEQRLRTAFEMSMLARELCLARLSHEHPEWTEAERRRELLRYAFSPGPLPTPLR